MRRVSLRPGTTFLVPCVWQQESTIHRHEWCTGSVAIAIASAKNVGTVESGVLNAEIITNRVYVSAEFERVILNRSRMLA
jgi:hypothetical protein